MAKAKKSQKPEQPKTIRVRAFLSIEYDADPANYPKGHQTAEKMARFDWEQVGSNEFVSIGEVVVFRGAEEVVKRKCGLCMDGKPCNFAGCPEDPANE